MGKQARGESRGRRNARAVGVRKRNRVLAGGGGLVIIGLLVAIVVSLVNAARHDDPADSQKQFVTPATATASGAIAVGAADAPVKLEVYLDYMCPFCGRFERANSGELERMIADNLVGLQLYPLSFLDGTSDGTRYSTRAANAVATVADRAPQKVLAFSHALFSRQPVEGGPGLSDDDIAALASNAGVPQDVVKLFREGIFEPWIARFTKEAFQNGVSGTPTVKINGKVFKGDLYTAGPLTQAVAAGQGQ